MSTLDKHMLKELLLVCSALGSVETTDLDGDGDGTGKQRFVRGENCLEWLQDLQRALRRDDDNTREICITISSWRVVQQKLIPLILECRDDGVLVKTLLKIYVMLTMPLSKSAEEALAKPVNPKAQGDVKDQQARRRENALAQQASLHAFKRAFISKDVLSVIVGMLEEPLSHIGVARTEEDNFSVELCLTLLRNVLNIMDPTIGLVTSLGDHYARMHEQLVVLFQDALLLDILLLLAQDVHARENAKLNLLLVEIFHCVVRDQEPGAVIAAHRAQVQREAIKSCKRGVSPCRQSGSSLTSLLAKEKNMRELASGQMHSRHTRFGGALQVGGATGTTSRIVANPFKNQVDCIPQAMRKKTKRGNTFTVDDASGSASSLSESHKAILAREALYGFCCSFLKTAYDPFMRSIKNEFRIDSSRLQPEDKGMMFRLMSFFMSFHHQQHQAAVKDATETRRQGGDPPKFELGHVLETMDLMSFNLVLREAETAISEKNTKRLAECVAVLKEMMHILTMLNESSEKAHQLVALGLLARIFYASEPLDKLHDIVRNWQPGKYSKSFLCHLVELVHTTLKALEWYDKTKSTNVGGVDVSAANGQPAKGQLDKDVLDRVSAAKKFDFERYFRRLAGNHTLRMYSNLLEHYATNSARTNHYILSFMLRLSTFKGETPKKRRGVDKANDTVTLEPMLYNIHTLGVFQKILDDPLARRSTFQHLVHYILSVVRHFGVLAQKNHVAFVEAFFQHPNPHAFCDKLVNVYHDDTPLDAEDEEPRKKRATRKMDTGEESRSDDDEDYSLPAAAGSAREEEGVGAGKDEADEEEWNEQSVETTGGAGAGSDGEEAAGSGVSRRKKEKRGKKARRRADDTPSRQDVPSKKKRAPRWTKEEDDYLREQFPRYADTPSAFAVLSMADEMEGKDRTEAQIMKRVKKLGITTATLLSPASGNGESVNEQEDGSGGDDILQIAPRSDRKEDKTPSPVRVRKIKRKSQAQSDDDSDMFGSIEEDEQDTEQDTKGHEETMPPTVHRSSKRAILQDSSDEE